MASLISYTHVPLAFVKTEGHSSQRRLGIRRVPISLKKRSVITVTSQVSDEKLAVVEKALDLPVESSHKVDVSVHEGSSNEETLSDLAAKLLKGSFLSLALAAALLGPVVDGAMAAQSGGRVGGSNFRSSARPPPPRVPPRVSRSNTNIYVAPPTVIAPPIYGGGFYGPPVVGGWGWTPFSYVAPGAGVVVGVGGFSFFTFLISLAIFGAIFNAIRSIFRRRDDNDYY
eukprot:TRINITY_DN6315_c0_g1_i7.p1 TRINITY_DN6315_c0_g1~~TRINITY_DN6315_c0_g1_i7.p1  ORF type:complete len:228 (+),score=30.73 TRINITY_DN6315_c0_g1_i7:145-828(+)